VGSPEVGRRSLLVGSVSLFGVLAGTACQKGPSFCNDVSSLKPDEVSAREALGYEELSTHPGQSCAKCQQYEPPPNIKDCGHCRVLKGTVHPNGSCRAFVAKT
jgi:hypothetical protein